MYWNTIHDGSSIQERFRQPINTIVNEEGLLQHVRTTHMKHIIQLSMMVLSAISCWTICKPLFPQLVSHPFALPLFFLAIPFIVHLSWSRITLYAFLSSIFYLLLLLLYHRRSSFVLNLFATHLCPWHLIRLSTFAYSNITIPKTCLQLLQELLCTARRLSAQSLEMSSNGLCNDQETGIFSKVVPRRHFQTSPGKPSV